MDVPIEQLGMCVHEDCRRIFYLGDMTPHQWVGIKCEWCGRPISWESLGRESVGAHGIYHKVRWVGPGGVWVDRKPEESFTLGRYYVMGGIPFYDEGTVLLPRSIILQHVVRCQKWKTEKSGVIAAGGFSLHKTIADHRMFICDMKGTGFFPDGNPYVCLAPPHVFEEICKQTKECGALFDIVHGAPAQYTPRDRGENVFELIVAA